MSTELSFNFPVVEKLARNLKSWLFFVSYLNWSIFISRNCHEIGGGKIQQVQKQIIRLVELKSCLGIENHLFFRYSSSSHFFFAFIISRLFILSVRCPTKTLQGNNQNLKNTKETILAVCPNVFFFISLLVQGLTSEISATKSIFSAANISLSTPKKISYQ